MNNIIGKFGSHLVLFWEFSKNENFSEGTIEKFNQAEIDIYPDVTLGMGNHLPDTKLMKYEDDKINVPADTHFLDGEYCNDKMWNVSFKDIVMKLNDFLLATCERPSNWGSVKRLTIFVQTQI